MEKSALPDSPPSSNNDNQLAPATSRQREAVRKRVPRERAKAYRELEKKSKENDKLKKKLEKYKKRLRREKNKQKTVSFTS